MRCIVCIFLTFQHVEQPERLPHFPIQQSWNWVFFATHNAICQKSSKFISQVSLHISLQTDANLQSSSLHISSSHHIKISNPLIKQKLLVDLDARAHLLSRRTHHLGHLQANIGTLDETNREKMAHRILYCRIFFGGNCSLRNALK